MTEFPFPDDIQNRGYRVFPDKFEDHELTVFHGTTWSNFEDIKKNGFKPAKELLSVKEVHPTSTSFSYTSPLALEYAYSKKSPDNPGVIIMVKFSSSHKVAKEAGGCWHLYDHANSQPEIIGFCRIPDEYRHV